MINKVATVCVFSLIRAIRASHNENSLHIYKHYFETDMSAALGSVLLY